MTVLPNAPIDDATGLPIPTIAVATGHGLSVIKDDGNVIDMRPTGSSVLPVKEVYFTKSNKLAFQINNNWINYYPISSSDATATYWNGLPNFIGRFTDTTRDWATNGIPINVGGTSYITDFVEDRAIGHTNGVDIIDINEGGLLGSGMHCGIAKDFNTGWQHGDIKGAWLSSNDTTNISGAELVANPGPSFSNTTNWYLDASNKDTGTIATLAVSSGRLVFTHSNTADYWDGFGISFGSLVVGQEYIIAAEVHAGTNMNVLRISDTASQHDADIAGAGATASAGLHSITFTATATTMYLHWNGYVTTSTITLNSVSVRLADQDRSVNNNGLQVFGTVTKTAVATGAELVSYGGFSATNFLEQPYNSDLNWQNNDFSVYGWFKLNNNGTQQTLMMLMQPDGEVDYLLIEQQSNGDMRFQVDPQSGASVAYATTLPTGGWHHYCGVNIDNDKTYLYINGEPTGLHNGQLHGTSDFDNTSAKLTIGRKSTASYNNASSTPFTGQMALWRISNTTPSAEQIKKMYNDEKKLFTTNAKCTLHGSSNAVTAIAHDDATNTLHVGTSAGRSEFVGLNRINNTTTAVAAAISASNGLVVDE